MEFLVFWLVQSWTVISSYPSVWLKWLFYWLLYLPTQMRFPIGREHVTCCVWKQSNSLGRIKLANSLGKQTAWTFDSHVMRPCALKPQQICVQPHREHNSSRHSRTFCSIFEWRGITKILMTGPMGNSLPRRYSFGWSRTPRRRVRDEPKECLCGRLHGKWWSSFVALVPHSYRGKEFTISLGTSH